MKESDHEEVPVTDFLFMNTSSFFLLGVAREAGPKSRSKGY